MERRELLAALESGALGQDELTERLIAEVKEHGAAIDELESLVRFQTEMQMARTSFIFEAACIVAGQEGRKTRQGFFSRLFAGTAA